MNGLVQCGLQTHGNCGSVQLVNTQATQPNSHFFLQGTRREQKSVTGLDMAGTADGIKGESRGNDNSLVLVQPETLVSIKEGRPPAQAAVALH